MRIVKILILGLLAAVVAYFLIQHFVGGGDIFPPKQGSTVLGSIDIVQEWQGNRISQSSIPIEDVRGGGPGKDGIPSLDNPKFVSVSEAEKEGLDSEGFGLSVTVDGKSRFYPYSILVWHEIVNDVVNDKPLLVTYCPLCFTGIVYDREVEVDGDRHELQFGVSGLLYDNNLLMYNRVLDQEHPPETLWSQARGEAVAGPLTGVELKLWSESETVQWKEWKQAYPKGRVLSRNTGYLRNYDRQPYGDYFERENNSLIFPLSHDDDRLLRKEVVEGVVINGEAKAYVRSTIERDAPLEDEVGGVPVVWEMNGGAVQLFNRETRERIGASESFWFSWVATYPETKLWP